LRSNLAGLSIREGFQIEQRSATLALRNLARRDPRFTLVYLDPPWEDTAAYTESLTLLAASSTALLAPEAIVIAEHARRGSATMTDTYGPLHRYRILEQGDAALSFYQLKNE
jgi:16S rRNA (guanine966-N2)-methyltransferase